MSIRLDSLNKDILRLSIPAILSNITVPLLGLCDIAISGHLGSELFLAAIAVGTVMLNTVFWMFGFLRGGTTGLTAVALGGNDEDEVAKVLFRASFIALAGGILLFAFQSPLFSLLKFISAPGEEIENLVESYFRIRIWGSPALLGTMVISGWFVGMQSTLYPMIIAIAMNIINIAVSFILVYPCDWGFAGVAYGTLISNWAGLVIGILCIILFRKGKPLRLHIRSLFKGGLWKYFAVNGNLFIRSFFIICVTLGVTAAGARLGSLTLAINAVGMQFFQFFSFFMDGFAFSGEALIGLRLGEKNMGMLHKSVKRLLGWTTVTAVIFTLTYLFGTDPITSLLTDSEEVRTGVGSILLFIVLIPFTSCWAFIFDGFYIGITDTGRMMISTFIGALIFFLLAFVSYGKTGISAGVSENPMIWAGFLGYLLARGIYLGVSWKSAVSIKQLG